MKDKIYVWDPLVRLFHWLLVALFITSYITGENESSIHIYSGYTILTLLTIRIIWGFVGSKYARFSDFVKSPAETIAYLKDLKSNKPSEKHYVGHNPAGGMMVLALLISISCTGFAGLKLYGAEGHGPFAVGHEVVAGQEREVKEHGEDVHEVHEKHEGHEDEAYEDEEAEEFWEEIHEFFVNFTLFLIILHIAGVVMSARKHNENLVKAMVTGYKEPLKEQE